MLALGFGQHHAGGDAIKDIGRRRAARPCSSHVYHVGLMLER